MQQRQTRAIKNARLLPDGCSFLNNTTNENLFRINISQPLTIAGFREGGTAAWPPGSLDLTPMDFFL